MVTPEELNKIDELRFREIIATVSNSIIRNHGYNFYEYGVYKGKLSYNIIREICIQFLNNGWKYVFYKISTKNKHFKKYHYVEFILATNDDIFETIDIKYNQIYRESLYNEDDYNDPKIKLRDFLNTVDTNGVVIKILESNSQPSLYNGYVYMDKVDESLKPYLDYKIYNIVVDTIENRNYIIIYIDVVVEDSEHGIL